MFDKQGIPRWLLQQTNTSQLDFDDTLIPLLSFSLDNSIDNRIINNLDEKSVQVPRMRALYLSAYQVWMWFGRPGRIFAERNGEFPMLKLALSSTFLRAEAEEKAKSIVTRMNNVSISTTSRIVAGSIIGRMLLELNADLDAAVYNNGEERLLPELDVVAELVKTGLSEDEIRDAVGFSPLALDSLFTSTSSDPSKLVLQKLLSQDEAKSVSSTLLQGLFRDLDCLLENAWFGRTWTIQEFVLSKEPPIALIGGFSFYLTCVYQIGKEISQDLRNLPLTMHARLRCIAPKIEVLSHLVNTFALEQGLEDVRLQQEARTTEHKLIWLLRTYSDNNTTVPHDKVYGMLGLLHTTLPEQLMPNYRIRFEQLCGDYTRHILSATQDLRIIDS
ncbi:hypothetical protein BDV96DRAFT_600555 [Lophiotrema nucula]|uniref:Uncharacterized protein n=1 Tax=Lophiotrema nucula TaxID=690887 RepID=A0A6A5Z588_9PLEO|nr:hypothetical protein BDV96DRAFT_600555 [Lophiotrema nucula]